MFIIHLISEVEFRWNLISLVWYILVRISLWNVNFVLDCGLYHIFEAQIPTADKDYCTCSNNRIYAFTYLHVCVSIHACMYVQLHVSTLACIYTYTYINVSSHTCICWQPHPSITQLVEKAANTNLLIPVENIPSLIPPVPWCDQRKGAFLLTNGKLYFITSFTWCDLTICDADVLWHC